MRPLRVTVPALVLTAACSSSSSPAAPDGGGDGGATCAPYESDADLTMPAVSFEKDVLPLFERNCSSGITCHGGAPSQAVSQRGVFLGCVPDASATCGATGDPGPEVYAGLVGANANRPVEESCLPFVTPGNPTESYLMNKLDNDLCAVPCCIDGNDAAAAVGEMGCGTLMPYLQAVLPPSTRDTIRRWIEQGAMNN